MTLDATQGPGAAAGAYKAGKPGPTPHPDETSIRERQSGAQRDVQKALGTISGRSGEITFSLTKGPQGKSIPGNYRVTGGFDSTLDGDLNNKDTALGKAKAALDKNFAGIQLSANAEVTVLYEPGGRLRLLVK